MRKILFLLVVSLSFTALADENVCQKKAQENITSISLLPNYEAISYDINEGSIIGEHQAYNINAQTIKFDFYDNKPKPGAVLWRHFCKCDYVTYNFIPEGTTLAMDGKKAAITSSDYRLLCEVVKETEKAKY